jgi:Prephenate dehydratase
MVILYLGPEGSFSHELCIKIDIKEELVPSKSIRNIFKLVSENKAKGVVPIENTLEGPVNETLDNVSLL